MNTYSINLLSYIPLEITDQKSQSDRLQSVRKRPNERFAVIILDIENTIATL